MSRLVDNKNQTWYNKGIMTAVYFIRHAESDTSVRDPLTRPLTAKGLADRRLVTDFLSDKNIDAVISSPFKRAVDTVREFAKERGFEIETVDGLRERKSDSDWGREKDVPPYTFLRRQWSDFTYTYSDGESLGAVQARNIAALESILDRYGGKNIVIGTHGMALSVIVNYYDKTYGFEDYMAMTDVMPWAVKMTFDKQNCVDIEKIDLFKLRG